MELREVYAENFWQLANLITGFAIAEVLATLFAVGSNPVFAKGVHDWRCTVVVFTSIAHLFYAAAVYYCLRQELKFLPQNAFDVRSSAVAVFGARTAVVVLAGGLLIFVTLAIPPPDK
jgi:hypothetical protein